VPVKRILVAPYQHCEGLALSGENPRDYFLVCLRVIRLYYARRRFHGASITRLLPPRQPHSGRHCQNELGHTHGTIGGRRT